MNPRFSEFIGVDFSGAVDAGRRLWVAIGHPEGDRLALRQLMRGSDLPDSGTARERALAALAAFLAGRERALIGCDFPFSLPRELIAAPDWLSFATGFAAAYPDPEVFRQGCRARSADGERRRRTDRETGTPFAAYNLRLYRQTYWGISRVLAPLAAESAVGIAPMHRHGTATTVVVESCPASTLKRLGRYRPYKGRGPALAGVRRSILAVLEDAGLACPEALAAEAIGDPGGDALDAIIAATAVWRTIGAEGRDLAPRDAVDALEARVYDWPSN
ncbi:MAG: hypothetical protein HKM95_02600 [Inquilinus sp.]|nr:hypothetical protein [Inquilinus sp.]